MLNKNKRSVWGVGLLILSAMLLLSCNNDNKQLHHYVAGLKETAEKNKKKENVLKLQLPTPTNYKAHTLRAPFQSSQVFSGSPGGLSNPLLVYPLNMLRFVGTISEQNVMYAYLLAPDNKLYQVKVGNRVGDRRGKIVNIYKNRVEVMEENKLGKTTTQRIVTLQLKDEHG